MTTVGVVTSKSFFTNDVAVRFVAQLLYELLSSGRIRHHGGVPINRLETLCADRR